MRPAVTVVLVLVAAFLLWQLWAFLAALEWLALLGAAGLVWYAVRRALRRRG